MFQYQDFEASGNPILIQNETTALPPPIINELHIYGGSYQNKLTGSQLLDGSKLEIGGLAENTGSPFDTNDRIRIQNIKVEPGKSYTLSGIDSNYVLANDHIFDADGNRISSFIVQLTMPDNAASASISFKKNDESECSEEDVVALKNSIMLNEGSTAKPYEPYTGGRPSPSPEYPQEIEHVGCVMSTGKNLLNLNDVTYTKCVKIDDSTVMSQITNHYFSTITITEKNVLDSVLNNKGKNMIFAIGEGIPDKTVTIIIKGTYTTGLPLIEKSSAIGGNVVVLQIPETLQAVTGIELRFNRSSSTFIDTTTIIRNLYLSIGTEDSFTEYEPYTGGKLAIIPGAGKIPLVVSGKNLIDIPEINAGIYTVVNECNITKTTILSCMSENIGVKKNIWRIAFHYKDGAIKYISDANINNNNIIIATEDNPIVKIIYRGIYIVSGRYTNIQLEYGTTATPYEPYTHQSLTLATPNGLPGIPVKIGGNYTDSKGQKYICDEIDLGRGKYVQRVKDIKLNGDTEISHGFHSNGNGYIGVSKIDAKKVNNLMSDRYIGGGWSDENGHFYAPDNKGIIVVDKRFTSLEEAKRIIGVEQPYFLYQLATPIERDLTPEEIAAYKSIITHNDTTVVSNNENCNMKIKYTKGVIMPQYDSTKLIVQMKALARTESMPIDSTEVWDSLAEAQSYINEANAYAGQTIKALVNGKYKTYTLQPSGGGYTLEEVGAVSQSDLKQYVQVVEQLPSSGQQQGVIYIVGTTGQIWTGSAWKVVFKEVSTQVDQLTTKVTQLEGEINKKAPINNPVFTGKVMVGSDEVAVKSYVDGLISNLVSSAPGVVDGDHPLPVDGYKAGQTWRVALAGTYAGQKCEVGDLIICIKDFNTQTNNSDFMVVQANVDGAVTSTATTSTVGEIVVFNAATGKVIKGSGVNISSLNDAISKAHTHANKAILDTYNKNQTQLLADAAITAQGKVDALKVEVDKKANKATTLAGYGITDAYTEAEIDAKLKTITDNVNTKVDAATVDSKINTAKGEIETAYNLAITEKLAVRVGSIPEDTDIKTYVDTAVGSGGTASAEAIAKAKQEAINASKAYTESQLQVTEF